MRRSECLPPGQLPWHSDARDPAWPLLASSHPCSFHSAKWSSGDRSRNSCRRSWALVSPTPKPLGWRQTSMEMWKVLTLLTGTWRSGRQLASETAREGGRRGLNCMEDFKSLHVFGTEVLLVPLFLKDVCVSSMQTGLLGALTLVRS